MTSKKSKKVKNGIFFASISVLTLTILLVVLIPFVQLKRGTKQIANGQYDAAISTLDGNYLNAAKKQKLLAEAGIYFGNDECSKGVKCVLEAGGTLDITYDHNGGTGNKDHETLKSGGRLFKPTYEGYIFSKWNVIDFEYSQNNFLVNLSVKAKWIAETYELSIYHNPRSVNMRQTFTYNEPYEIDIPRYVGRELENIYVNEYEYAIPQKGIWTYTDAKYLNCRFTDHLIEIGTYPQTMVTDEELLNSLNSKITGIPSSTNYHSWTGYSYPSQNTYNEYSWYKDVTEGNDKYRAVYFNRYRHIYSFGNPSENPEFCFKIGDDFTFSLNHVYWFRFEPIKWRILQENNNTTFLTSDLVLDTVCYNTTNIDENKGYESSYVRNWLNNDFYNNYFTNEEKDTIDTTSVDNSVNQNRNNFGFSSQNTNDKIFLLSGMEYCKNLSSGYGGPNIGTDYAYSQGLWYTSNGECEVLLRSRGQFNNYVEYAEPNMHIVGSEATMIFQAGIKPAMVINYIGEY